MNAGGPSEGGDGRDDAAVIARNIEAVRDRIAAAARRAGRDPWR